MLNVVGDIFSCAPQDAFIVIPTNVGWTRGGLNVMGAGLAKEASKKFPDLTFQYGEWCQQHGGKIYVDKMNKIICLPSKPLVEKQPWASWRQKSKPETIRESFKQLKAWAKAHPKELVKVPLFGSGNGGLSVEVAVQLVDEAKFPDSVYLVTLKAYS